MIFRTPSPTAEELEVISRIDALREELRPYVVSPRRWFGSLRRLAVAKAVQGSNSIEGYRAGLDDVFAAIDDEEPLDADTATRQALLGYRDAMTYVLQLAEQSELRIDTTLIKALHFMMIKHELQKWPGRWRPGPVFVTRESDYEVVYEGPSEESVPSLMEELVESLTPRQEVPALFSAAMAHLNVAMIHPFKDGNGRMARCLHTLALARERVVPPVFSSIEEYLGANTQSYYDILASVGQGRWNPQLDARAWVRYCLSAHYLQAQTQLFRVRETEQMWDRAESLARRYQLPLRSVGAINDAARGFRIRNESYRKLVLQTEGAEISELTATRDLKALVQNGVLVAHGERRGRFYVGSADVTNEYQRIRVERPALKTNRDLFEVSQEPLPGLGDR
jgi:Fic family protein